MRLDRRIVLSMFALGISPFIMASTESLVGFVLNSSLKNFGDIYVSALAILQSAMQFASVPLTGFAQGFVPIISYNYGHGDKQRVKDCFRIVLIVMFSFNLILMLFMILFPSTRIGCHGRYLLYVVIYMEIPEDTRENQAKRRKGCPITDSPLIKP